MTENGLKTRYFNWMYRLVCDNEYSRGLSYRKLLRHFHKTEFFYSIPMDGNRAEDGADLRYRFGYERSYDGPTIATYLDDKPCSVLEMMVALSVRCEEIMEDPEIGDRTGLWFWNMLANLGLDAMDDQQFDPDDTDDILNRFMNREYGSHGEGGLFLVRDPQQDLSNVEIWYQMNWYLDENF